ncbi:hypothetical protein GIB67_021404, partial [Kingdonia uniflora]
RFHYADIIVNRSISDTWSILSNVRQLLPNIDSSHINSGNVSIAHLRTYLIVAADREDDITIVHTFILFMIGHLWFQNGQRHRPAWISRGRGRFGLGCPI